MMEYNVYDYLGAKWAEWLLLLTWTIVIPYIIMFPPKLARLRRGLQHQREQKDVKAMRLNTEWTKKNPTSGEIEAVVPRGHQVTLVFVNRKSGGQVGGALVSGFKELLSGAQVYDLSETDPTQVLKQFSKSSLTAVRILIAGGDGTVSWVMGAAEEAHCPFPIAILPLGTGNDLSRSLYWGSGFAEGEATIPTLRKHLSTVHHAEVTMVDRWVVTVKDNSGERRLPMNNYFSTGIDAEISMKFHQERQLHPERFTSQQHNVMKYAFYGFEGAFEGTPLGNSVSVKRLDGDEIEVNPLWKGVIISNVPCYHGGKNFWGDSSGDSFTAASINDGLLEVMGVAGTLHIGLINLAVDNAMRLEQCNGVSITVAEGHEACFQVDGEPWCQQGPATVTASLMGQYPMLEAPRPESWFSP